MNLNELFTICSAITKEKGFDVSQIRTQMLLIVSEVVEALEHVSNSMILKTDSLSWDIIQLLLYYEQFRKTAINYLDESKITDTDSFLEELADIQIRLASLVEGNNLTNEFMVALQKKIEKNKTRTVMHGKGF